MVPGSGRYAEMIHNAGMTRTIVVNFVHGQSQSDDDVSRLLRQWGDQLLINKWLI